MGCDIHMYVEHRETRTAPWQLLASEDTDRWVYGGRNYSLFAMLADVRNGSGFAGVDLGDAVVPIDFPRGLPADVSDEVWGESEEWSVDGHSHSWFTAAELLEVPWSDSTMTHRVQVRRQKGAPPFGERRADLRDPDLYAKQIEEIANSIGELPLSYGWHLEACGWSSEGAAGGWRGVTYTSTWAQATGPAWLSFLLELYRLSEGDPHNVRIVFWFDN